MTHWRLAAARPVLPGGCSRQGLAPTLRNAAEAAAAAHAGTTYVIDPAMHHQQLMLSSVTQVVPGRLATEAARFLVDPETLLLQ